jgi:catechol-2,3-dioxygenase
VGYPTGPADDGEADFDEEAKVGEDGFGLHTIGQLRIPVTDADRAAAFYRDVLGMRFLFAYPGIALLRS